ncbi:unnamed protein product [Timema podura]|uniref:Uncharacterized protein n=1 Tax=Timema podura TaxID=61482 RepID=A0ABN7NP55_TIMPD|nr:unnamed protein product [Timema podura]
MYLTANAEKKLQLQTEYGAHLARKKDCNTAKELDKNLAKSEAAFQTSKFSVKDEPLFNPELLKRLNFSHVSKVFNPPISAAHPGESLVVRPLCRGDYDRGKSLLSFMRSSFINCVDGHPGRKNDGVKKFVNFFGMIYFQ